MIKQFADKVTTDIYHGVSSKYARKIPRELHSKARRLMDQLNASPTLGFLRIPPGNRLEKMFGDLKGFYSVRINDQWKIIFQWIDNDAYDVKITDYRLPLGVNYAAQTQNPNPPGRNAIKGIPGAFRNNSNKISQSSRLALCQTQ